jgi:hypothetical protein
MEESGRGLICGTTTPFAWRELETTKKFNQDSRPPGLDMNPRRPE